MPTKDLPREWPPLPGNMGRAIEYVNCLGDDVTPGKEGSFPQAVKLREDEIVASSWAVSPSREERDRANKAIMDDEGCKDLANNIPVDLTRMFTGGVKVLRGLRA